jgi:hypothetical protein
VSKLRGGPPQSSVQTCWDVVQTALLWRPRTVLEYLILVAVFGILLALATILGVELHLAHRFL